MIDILQREFIYIWYYFEVQLLQIFRFWMLGTVLGSVISVFGKQKIHALFESMKDKKLGLFGIIPDDWLAAFMMNLVACGNVEKGYNHEQGDANLEEFASQVSQAWVNFAKPGTGIRS